ncbi:DUF4253 domain-containing protein [Amycolatopsis sp. NPDC059021]|uniref:DUF4253 domain-containing protein n=1 Tax=Amycolatopsis sp. NPDC059021 TaxID=3346704 RepID=UPI00367179FC
MTVLPFRRSALGLEAGLETPKPDGCWHGPIWLSAERTDPATYAAFLDDATKTGFWPLIVQTAVEAFDGVRARSGSRPLDQEDPLRLDPAEILAHWWRTGPHTTPATSFPGLVRRSTARRDPLLYAMHCGTELLARDGGRLGLARVRLSADVPFLIGWPGAGQVRGRADAVAAVLGSWEHRFGTRLVGIGSTGLTLSVAAPPTTLNRALAIAAEHRAFCPRICGEDHESYAHSLLNHHIWRLRWS